MEPFLRKIILISMLFSGMLLPILTRGADSQMPPPTTRRSTSAPTVESLKMEVRRLELQLASARAELAVAKAELAKIKGPVGADPAKPAKIEPHQKSTFASRAKAVQAPTLALKKERADKVVIAEKYDLAIAGHIAASDIDVKIAEALYEARPAIGMTEAELRLFANLDPVSESANGKSFWVWPYDEIWEHAPYGVGLVDGKVAKILHKQ